MADIFTVSVETTAGVRYSFDQAHGTLTDALAAVYGELSAWADDNGLDYDADSKKLLGSTWNGTKYEIPFTETRHHDVPPSAFAYRVASVVVGPMLEDRTYSIHRYTLR